MTLLDCICPFCQSECVQIDQTYSECKKCPHNPFAYNDYVDSWYARCNIGDKRYFVVWDLDDGSLSIFNDKANALIAIIQTTIKDINPYNLPEKIKLHLTFGN